MDNSFTLSKDEGLVDDGRFMPFIKFTTKFPNMDFERWTCGPLTDILRDDATRGKSDGDFSCDDVNAICVPSALDSRRSRHASRPSCIRIASFLSTSNPISNWFDESPKRSVFAVEDDAVSMLSWSNKIQQWFDDVDLAYSTFPNLSYPMPPRHKCDNTSMSSFGPSSEEIPSLISESHGSHTILSTPDDPRSPSSSDKNYPFDGLDEQLINSPMDSFTAMCWDCAVVPDQPTEKRDSGVAELRYSKLYSDAAQQYEVAQLRESSQLASVALPEIKFTKNRVQTLKTAPVEVAPWLYIPKKAATVLDLPQDLSTALAIQESITSSRGVHQRHRQAKATLSSITKLPFSITRRKKSMTRMGRE